VTSNSQKPPQEATVPADHIAGPKHCFRESVLVMSLSEFLNLWLIEAIFIPKSGGATLPPVLSANVKVWRWG